ncbi:hypothetical protein MMC25_005166 [Agyrium rufum]|nr:hypothetical protein [Agyrium rufum]
MPTPHDEATTFPLAATPSSLPCEEPIRPICPPSTELQAVDSPRIVPVNRLEELQLSIDGGGASETRQEPLSSREGGPTMRDWSRNRATGRERNIPRPIIIPDLGHAEGTSPSIQTSKEPRRQYHHDFRVPAAPLSAVDRSAAGGERARLASSPLPSTRAGPNSPAFSYEFSQIRQIPNWTSSFLRPGSKFRGKQEQSPEKSYNVEVNIKYVDMKESFLCGFLHIEGLTNEYPDLTTYFEGEIIGPKYSFITKHESWGATKKSDLAHWDEFVPFRSIRHWVTTNKYRLPPNNGDQYIYMRWKETFLVPDHKIAEIKGASFEGFYYICFNQRDGTIRGIYFYAGDQKSVLQSVTSLGNAL